MKIGILECGHTVEVIRANHGDFPDMFQRLLAGHGFDFVSYDIENMEFPGSITACDGWLLTGSKHGAYEDHAFIPPLEDFVRDAYAAHVPMVGICFGHQIIAQALGGQVEKFTDGWSIGLTEYRFDDLGEIRLNAWHQDQVIQAPADAIRIASSSFCENAALVYGTRAFTVQPHPEFDGNLIADYVKLRKGTADYPDDIMDRALSKAGMPAHDAAIAEKIAAFFKQTREAINV